MSDRGRAGAGKSTSGCARRGGVCGGKEGNRPHRVSGMAPEIPPSSDTSTTDLKNKQRYKKKKVKKEIFLKKRGEELKRKEKKYEGEMQQRAGDRRV